MYRPIRLSIGADRSLAVTSEGDHNSTGSVRFVMLRLLRMARLIGAIALVLLIPVWALSLSNHLGYGTRGSSISLARGLLVLSAWNGDARPGRNDTAWGHAGYSRQSIDAQATLRVYGVRYLLGLRWIGVHAWQNLDSILIPVWIPVASALLVAALAHVLVRLCGRAPRDHCPCGYDLTGNVSGNCPECGAAAGRPDNDHGGRADLSE